MKRAAYILTALLLAAACGEETVPETVNLSVDRNSLEFTADGGNKTFTVTASEQLYLVPGHNWISVSKGSKDTGHKTVVTVTAEANPDAEVRASRVSVVAGEEKLYVEVSQEAGEGNTGGNNVVPENNGSTAWKMAERLGAGWNLGNQMDAHINGVSDETCWGNGKATQATFDKVKAAGFSSVRIPVTWMGHIGEAPDYKINEDWMARVEELVDYAENAGLNAIVNMHHDGADSEYWLNIKAAAANAADHGRIMDQLSKMWTQIAERFRDRGDFLIFESMNEIHDGNWGWGTNTSDGGRQYTCYNEWQQAFVDAVRATGGNNATRYLGIPGYCTNADLTIEHLVLPEDTAENRLMVAVHCYDPYEYCIEGSCSEWGHTAAKDKKASWGDEDHLIGVFEKLYVQYIAEGIPVYMGEMGCVSRTTARAQAFQQYYLEYYAKAASTYGIPPFIWDNGASGGGNESHAFIEHSTGEYIADDSRKAVAAFVKGINEKSADYTIGTVYANAPR